jgi:hypothetical protein
MTSSRIQLPRDVPAYVSTPEEPSQPANPSSRGWFWLTLVLLLSALYMAHELKRGWIPSDDGVLAESAERVLHGALPHRDYHELYTGLLSYLNAAAFQTLGTNLASMRYVLFLFCLAWALASYYAASRFVSAPVASAVTLLAAVWGPPNGPIPMPSWYNLFFATFGLAALLRYIEDQKRRWLILAGICGGVSFLFKMSGLYFVAGALLFLAFREQMNRRTKPTRPINNVLYSAFVVLSVFSYEALLLVVLSKHANVATYLYFWLPNLAIGATILWYEFCVDANRARRFPFLFRELALFGVGVALPILAFLVPYLVTGSLSQFFTDLLIQPVQLVLSNSVKPPGQWFLEGSVANLLLIGIMRLTRSRTAPKLWEEVLLGLPLALLIPSVLLLTHQSVGFYQLAWSTIWVFAPFVVVLGVGLLVRRSLLSRLTCMQGQRLFVTLSVTAVCGLIQFPFSIPCIYFCYAAPLVVLSATAVVSMMQHPPRVAVIGMMSFCFLYAVFEFTPGYIFHMGREYAPDIQTVTLLLPRAGGIRVSAATAREYEELDGLIRRHARGEYIFAAPNCPQVYFLSGLRSPTNDFLGFLDDFEQAPGGVLRTLQAHHVNLIVLNHLDSMFVQPVPDDLHSALEREFPSHAETENFEVRWNP